MNQVAFPPGTRWIGSDHAFDLHEAYLRFRRMFQLTTAPESALLRITGDARYKLWVNGRFVGRGPARSYPQAQAVDEYDLSTVLRPGTNVVAAQVYQPGYSFFAYVHRANAGLLAHLVVGGETVLVTDTAWKHKRDPSYNPIVPRISIYQAGVEDRDLHWEDDWQQPGYDDSDWGSARVTADLGAYPWTGYQPRALPFLTENNAAQQLTATRIGPTQPHRDPHIALRNGWAAAAELAIQSDDNGWFSISLTDNESAYWVYDLGRGYTCQGWFEASNAAGTEVAAISYSEKSLDNQPAQPYISDPDTYCRVRMTDRIALRPGDQTGVGFSLRGGRYMLFQLDGPTHPDFKVRWHTTRVEYPLEVARPLALNDELLNNIVTVCENTLSACLFDGFVDNPWRESAQWIGDALPNTFSLHAMSDDLRATRRVLELAAQGAYPDGILPGVIPSEAHAYTVVDFNFQWVEMLNAYHRFTGDDALVAQLWPTLVTMLDRFHEDLNADGLLVSQPGRRLFLDWAPNSKNEPNAAYNLHYLCALQNAIELAKRCGIAVDPETATGRWHERAAGIHATARQAFWRDGRWYDDLEGSTFSQLSASLAVLTGASTDTELDGVLSRIASRSLSASDAHDPSTMVLASPYMHFRVFAALLKHGMYNEMIEIIKVRWGRWVRGGYPTVWENWDVDFPDGSQAHGFSAHPRYFLAELKKQLPDL